MMLDNAPEMRIEVDTAPEAYFPGLRCEDVRQLRVPTLLVTGALSPLMFHRIADELARCLPMAERAVIPAASHAMHLGTPQAYSETVLAFLARH
jgi:non-heme chloroperoxidase